MSWSTAWRAIAAAARHKIAGLPQAPPRRLGVDETTFRRHRSFMTGLVDLEVSRLWDLIEGRSKKALVARLEALGEQVTEIEAVVIDPYAGYKAAVRDLAPGAVRVADRFHIQRLADWALTEVRCRRQQDLTGHRGRKGDPLWAARRDLLRSRHNLTAAAWERLDTAFRADCWDEIECAWTIKEMLADLYASADRAAAEAAPADWHHHAGAFDVAETNRLARTLRTWQPELLAYFDDRLTNGPTEGTNRIIKAVNGKASATPTPRTTAGASCTAAHDTLTSPGNRTPACPTKHGEPANPTGRYSPPSLPANIQSTPIGRHPHWRGTCP